MAKNILVTGGAGFIGSNFVRYVLDADPQACLVNLDLLTYAGSLENLTNLPDPSRHTFIQGDIGDTDLLLAFFKNFKSIRSSILPQSRTSTVRSQIRRRSSAPTSTAPLRCSRQRVRRGCTRNPRWMSGCAFTTYPPTKSLAA